MYLKLHINFALLALLAVSFVTSFTGTDCFPTTLVVLFGVILLLNVPLAAPRLGDGSDEVDEDRTL